MRGDDFKVNKMQKILPPSRSKNRSNVDDKGAETTPVYPKGRFDFSSVNQDIDGSIPWSTLSNGRLDDAVTDFTEVRLLDDYY